MISAKVEDVQDTQMDAQGGRVDVKVIYTADLNEYLVGCEDSHLLGEYDIKRNVNVHEFMTWTVVPAVDGQTMRCDQDAFSVTGWDCAVHAMVKDKDKRHISPVFKDKLVPEGNLETKLSKLRAKDNNAGFAKQP